MADAKPRILDAKPHVLIVSRNAQTAKGLRAYFHQRHITVSVTDRLVTTDGPDEFTAVVVFPDEFPMQEATDTIGTLTRRWSRAWMVVVTRHVARFEQQLVEVLVDAPGRLMILPRPVWGWALLDRVLQSADA